MITAGKSREQTGTMRERARVMKRTDHPRIMSLRRVVAAECFGTFWLVFGGCGSAIFSNQLSNGGIGTTGVALAFGLTLLTMACTISPISGCHINPAVTLAACISRRLAWR